MTTLHQRDRQVPAVLVLEDGRIFRGRSYGAWEPLRRGVFATGMTGYQETLTDPSYARQLVVQTAPHIGNTGVNSEDAESAPHLGGRLHGPRRRPPPLQLALRARPGRGTRRAGHRRHPGRGHPRPHPPPARAQDHARRHLLRRRRARRPGKELLARVRASPHGGRRPRRGSHHRRGLHVEPKDHGSTRDAFTIAAIDLGIKAHDPAALRRARRARARAARHRHPRGRQRAQPRRRLHLQRPRRPGHRRPPRSSCCAPCWTRRSRTSASASATRSWAAPWASAPTSCATATAASTSRSGPPHRQGGDHRAEPRLRRRRTAGRRQPAPRYGRVEVSHVCLNDDVVEGLACLDIPAFSVQYHPEAAAGPHDAAYLFDRFIDSCACQGHREQPGQK